MKKIYDLEMINDFMKHLGWELRIKHFESTHERGAQTSSPYCYFSTIAKELSSSHFLCQLVHRKLLYVETSSTFLRLVWRPAIKVFVYINIHARPG